MPKLPEPEDSSAKVDFNPFSSSAGVGATHNATVVAAGHERPEPSKIEVSNDSASWSSGRLTSPPLPPPPPAYDDTLSMPLSPRRYHVSAAAPKPAPATAGDLATAAPPSCAVARGMSEATDKTNPLSPSTSPRHEQPGSSPEFRMTVSSGAAATVPAPTRAAAGAPVGAGGVVPPPLPHRVTVLPALEKTDERGVADATKGSGDLATSTDQSDETPSNIVQEVAEDMGEGVADMMQAIRGVFGRGKSDDGDDADATPPPPQRVVYGGGGDSGTPEQRVFPVSAVLSRVESPEPSSSSSAPSPVHLDGGAAFSRVFGALKAAGVTTDGDSSTEMGDEKEQDDEAGKGEEEEEEDEEEEEEEEVEEEEEQSKGEETEDLGSSAVSRLRQIFERSDGKKRAILEAGPIPGQAVSTIGESAGEDEAAGEAAGATGSSQASPNAGSNSAEEEGANAAGLAAERPAASAASGFGVSVHKFFFGSRTEKDAAPKAVEEPTPLAVADGAVVEPLGVAGQKELSESETGPFGDTKQAELGGLPAESSTSTQAVAPTVEQTVLLAAKDVSSVPAAIVDVDSTPQLGGAASSASLHHSSTEPAISAGAAQDKADDRTGEEIAVDVVAVEELAPVAEKESRQNPPVIVGAPAVVRVAGTAGQSEKPAADMSMLDMAQASAVEGAVDPNVPEERIVPEAAETTVAAVEAPTAKSYDGEATHAAAVVAAQTREKIGAFEVAQVELIEPEIPAVDLPVPSDVHAVVAEGVSGPCATVGDELPTLGGVGQTTGALQDTRDEAPLQGANGEQQTVVAAVEDATTAGNDDEPCVTAAEEEGPQDGDLAPLASATFDFSSPTTATNGGPSVEPSGDVPAIREVAPPPATTEGMVASSGDVPALGKAAPSLAAPKNMSSSDSDCGVIAPSRAGPLPEVAAKAPDTAKIGGLPTKTVVDQPAPGGVEEALSEEGEIEHQTPAPKQEGAPILASAPFDGTAVSELEVSAVQAPGKMPQVQGTEQAASMVEDVVAAVGQESNIAPIEAAGVIPAESQAKPTATVEKPSEDKEVEKDGATEPIQVPGEVTSAVADPAPTVAADGVAAPSPGENTTAPDITEGDTTDGNVREPTEEPDIARAEEPVKAMDPSAMETKVEGPFPESTTERVIPRIFGSGHDRPAVLPKDDTPSDKAEEGPPAAVAGDVTCASGDESPSSAILHPEARPSYSDATQPATEAATGLIATIQSSGGGDADTSTARLEDSSTRVSMETPGALNEDGAAGEATIEASDVGGAPYEQPTSV
ncbi:unnamed protein product, partial [Ectocarpus sp. 6 AP-2014]